MSVDYFISYTAADVQWAEWVAWVLEEKNKCTTILQAWDFVPGNNFVLEMQKAASYASRTIAVLSPDYLRSKVDPYVNTMKKGLLRATFLLFFITVFIPSA